MKNLCRVILLLLCISVIYLCICGATNDNFNGYILQGIDKDSIKNNVLLAKVQTSSGHIMVDPAIIEGQNKYEIYVEEMARIKAENEAKAQEAIEVQYIESEIYYEPSEPTSSSSNYSQTDGYDYYFKSMGVIYDDNGTRYTWYSQNVLPGGGLTELNNNGRHVNEQGYVCDGDGYIAVASSDYPKGTIVETPFGTAKVYDTGCASGTIDVYTDF